MTRSQCTITICAVGFILGLPFVMNGGFYLFELVDTYATLIACFSVCLLESFIVTRYVGLDVIKELVKTKTDKEIPDYVYYSLERISPIANLVLIIICCLKEVSNVLN
jgi:SNF family Na+-dependent transporter